MDRDVARARLDALHGDGDAAPDGVVVGLDEGDETHPVVLRLQVARQSHVGDLEYRKAQIITPCLFTQPSYSHKISPAQNRHLFS